MLIYYNNTNLDSFLFRLVLAREEKTGVMPISQGRSSRVKEIQ